MSSNRIEIQIDAADHASSVLGGIGKALGGIGDIAKGVFVGGILGKGLDLLGGAIGGVKDAMIGGNAEFERYQTQFGVLMGGADKAKERLNMLAEFGAKTPFELPELVKADKVLLSFGLHSDTTAKKFGVSGEQILTTIGDIAAGTGVGFEELSLTFGKFASGSTGDAIARFQELGIATREQMASWGLEFSKSGQLLTPVDKALGILEQNMRKKFGGMMDAQSQTFEGMVSNFQDWLGQVGRMLGAPIFDALKENLGGLLAFLGSDSVKGAISGMAAGIATGIKQVIDFLKSMQPAFESAGMFIEAFVYAITGTSEAIEPFSDTIGELAENAGFGKLGYEIARVVSGIGYFVSALMSGGDVLGTFKAKVESFSETSSVRSMFLEMIGAAESFGASFNLISFQIEMAMITIQPALNGILQSVVSIFGSLIPIALTSGLGAWTMISTTIQTVITSAIAILHTWLPVVQTVLAGIAAFLAQHGAEIQLLVSTAWNAITTIIQTAITTATTIINALAPVVNEIFGAISAFLNAHGSEILGFLTDAWNSISAIVSGVAAIIQKVVTAVFGAVASFIKNHGDEIQTVLTGAWNFIKTTIGGALDIIKGLVSAALAIVNGDWDTAWKSLESVTKASNDIIKSLIDTAMGLIEGVIKLAVDNFELGWENGWKLMQTATDTAMTLIKDAINTGIETAKTVIANGVEAFIAKFNNLKDKMSVIGQQLLEGMVQGIRDKVGWLVDEAVRASTAVLSAIKSTLGIHSPSKEGEEITFQTIAGLANEWVASGEIWIDAAVTTTERMVERVRMAVEPLPDIVGGAATQTAAQTVSAFSGLADGVEDQLLTVAESFVELAQTGDISSLNFAQAFDAIKRKFAELTPTFGDVQKNFDVLFATMASGEFDVQTFWDAWDKMLHEIKIGSAATLDEVNRGLLDTYIVFEDGSYQLRKLEQSAQTSFQHIAETVTTGTNIARDAINNSFENILVVAGVAINTLTGEVVNSSNTMSTAMDSLANRVTGVTQTMQTQASSAAQSIAASMIAAGQVINTTQQQLAGFVQSGGVGGITGGIYTPSAAFQALFTNPPPAPIIAPPRPASVPKQETTNNNVVINLDVYGVDERTAKHDLRDGVMDALRQSGLSGVYG